MQIKKVYQVTSKPDGEKGGGSGWRGVDRWVANLIIQHLRKPQAGNQIQG